jgi:hypothetical protein
MGINVHKKLFQGHGCGGSLTIEKIEAMGSTAKTRESPAAMSA